MDQVKGKVKVEVFLSIPPCSGGISLRRLLDEVSQEFGERLDFVVHEGPNPRVSELGITSLPALVIGDLVRIEGLCPSKETFVAALRECGLIE